jgi:hypothetical protein
VRWREDRASLSSAFEPRTSGDAGVQDAPLATAGIGDATTDPCIACASENVVSM